MQDINAKLVSVKNARTFELLLLRTRSTMLVADIIIFLIHIVTFLHMFAVYTWHVIYCE